MTRKPRVLFQDDEEPMRKFLSAMLTRLGYECRAVESPEQVFNILKSGEEFEVLICGLLESLDADLFRRMGKAFPHTIVIACSGCSFESALPAFHHGAYDFLQKPVTREQLLGTVQRALEYRRLKLPPVN